MSRDTPLPPLECQKEWGTRDDIYQQEIDALRARIVALARFAQHPMDCGFTDHGERDPDDCTCGLSDLLARLRDEQLVP